MGTSTTAPAAHQGRWGYYPCSYDEFLRLKKAHKLFLRAIRDQRNYDRWIRKDPVNRVITRKWKEGDRSYREVVGPKPEPTCPAIPQYVNVVTPDAPYGVQRQLYQVILEQYRRARRPQPTPDAVVALSLPDGFEGWLTALTEFYAA